MSNIRRRQFLAVAGASRREPGAWARHGCGAAHTTTATGVVTSRGYTDCRFGQLHYLRGVPAGLRTIHFSPALPGILHEAIQTARSSANTGFFLRARRAFWEDDGLPPSLWSDTLFERLLAAVSDDRDEILCICINGDNAARVDRLGDRAPELLLHTLARIRPSTKGQLDVVGRISWGPDPFIGGEKYVMGPGQVTRHGKCISEPVGLIHWTGEHHKSRDQGAKAALQSGERAARALLHELRPERIPQASQGSIVASPVAQYREEKPQ